MTPEAEAMNMLAHAGVAIGDQLDRMAEHFGVPPRDVVFDDDQVTTAPDGKRYLADDAFRQRILNKLRGMPAASANFISDRSTAEHYDAIMAPGLSHEAMAEGLRALDLYNSAGTKAEGERLLAEWYARYAGASPAHAAHSP
jgi:hypothetical protein